MVNYYQDEDALPEPNPNSLHFVVKPALGVGKNQVHYPPIIVKAFVPNEILGYTFLAVPWAVNGDGDFRDWLRVILGSVPVGPDGSFDENLQDKNRGDVSHQGVIVQDGIPDISSSSNISGFPPEGYHTVCFVLHRLAFNHTGEFLRVRVRVLNLTMGAKTLGILGTIGFKVGGFMVARKRPGKSTSLSVYSVFFWDGI